MKDPLGVSLVEFPYCDSPCYLEVNRDKVVLINRLRKCKKGDYLMCSGLHIPSSDIEAFGSRVTPLNI